MRKRVADEILDEILDVTEALLKAQLAAIENLRHDKEPSGSKPGKDANLGRKSQVSIVYEVLKQAGRPLHVNDIIALVREQQGIALDRDSLVSAITKKVKRGEVFVRTGRNTFGLRGEAEP